MHPFQINSHISGNDILPVKLPKESAEEDVLATVFEAHRQDNFPHEQYKWL